MKNNLWIFFAIIGAFMGFLLGYSTPPMMEVGLSDPSVDTSVEGEQISAEDEDLTEYYKDLQEIGD